MDVLFLSIGLMLTLFSVKKLKLKIRESAVKTILPLPLWSIICLAAGIFLGYNSVYILQWKFFLIIRMLILTIPLQAWIDARFIYKNGIWSIKDFLVGCSYEIGLIIIGVSLTRYVLT